MELQNIRLKEDFKKYKLIVSPMVRTRQSMQILQEILNLTNMKYIDKTIQYKINDIEKNTYKPLVINTDSDIDGSIDDIYAFLKVRYFVASGNFSSVNRVYCVVCFRCRNIADGR